MLALPLFSGIFTYAWASSEQKSSLLLYVTHSMPVLSSRRTQKVFRTQFLMVVLSVSMSSGSSMKVVILIASL